MTRRWQPTDSMLRAVDLRAAGMTQSAIADATGTDIRTVQRWCALDAWQDLVEERRHQLLADMQPKHAQIISLALDLLIEVGLGERLPGDPRAEWATDVLSRTLWPLLLARGFAAAGVPVDPRQPLRLAQGG